MRAGPPQSGHHLRFWKVGEMPADSFADAFAVAAEPFPQEALSQGSWNLEGDALRALRTKITAGRPTLKEAYGSPLYGIKTGLNEAFVIDTPTKERLCRDDPRSAELLKPFLEGKDVKRWRAESRGLWIIYIPKNRVCIEDYTAIRDWLLPYKDKLEKRATKQEWFELQQAQEAYAARFSRPKITYSRFLANPAFWLDENGRYINNALFSLPSNDPVLLAILNSPVCWFHLKSQSTNLSGGFSQADAEDLQSLAIPAVDEAQRDFIEELVLGTQKAAQERHDLQNALTRRIPDLAIDPATARLNSRLKAWWDFPHFAAFQIEAKKAMQGRIPLEERNDWENWFTSSRAKIHSLTAEIARLEAAINAQVFSLFDLNPGEIALLETNV
ncbi:TaqI-like C-terminal specificity domain-containing protein [Sphingomonas rhizophila]